MKKFLSLVLAIILVFPTFLTLRVSAAEVDLSDYEQHIALAKKTFPEYVDKLEGNKSLRSSVPQAASSEPNVVIRETREADRNTFMTYTEYDTGLVTLGTARFVQDADLIIEDSVTHSAYEEFTATIIASVVEGPTFTATDVKYRIYPSNYDRITSAGNYGIPGYPDDLIRLYLRGTETSSLFACASYSFPCPVGPSSYTGEVILKLSNNVASVEFDIR